MALGVPVIPTALGAEGLDWVAGEELLIAIQKADFIAGIGFL
jgi:hypothetical protein